jgi:hypothetical protein
LRKKNNAGQRSSASSSLHPRFRHFNTNENRITIMDKKVGWDDKEGKRQPRMIDIYVKPIGEYELWCEYCNSNKCEHAPTPYQYPT